MPEENILDTVADEELDALLEGLDGDGIRQLVVDLRDKSIAEQNKKDTAIDEVKKLKRAAKGGNKQEPKPSPTQAKKEDGASGSATPNDSDEIAKLRAQVEAMQQELLERDTQNLMNELTNSVVKGQNLNEAARNTVLSLLKANPDAYIAENEQGALLVDAEKLLADNPILKVSQPQRRVIGGSAASSNSGGNGSSIIEDRLTKRRQQNEQHQEAKNLLGL